MKVLVTSGGTTEYIDDVRVLTNISTGKLGAEIAEAFWSIPFAHHVTYIASKNAKIPDINMSKTYRFQLIEVTDVASLMSVMEQEVPKHDIVIHAMAVSDFGFKRDQAVKLKSNDPLAFIEYMRSNIVVNPKVISYIKKWNPNCKLVGFKFEVGLTLDALLDIAFQSLEKNCCDLVIANDKAEMERRKEHIAYFCEYEKQEAYESIKLKRRLRKVIKAMGKADIAQLLVKHFKGEN